MRVEREAVLESATQVLTSNPRAPTGEIAAAAGISRATLHRFFPSRDDLVEAIGLLAVDRIDAAFAAARLDVGPVPEAWTQLVEAVLPAVHQFAFLINEAQIASNATLLEQDQVLQLEVERTLRRGRAKARFAMTCRWPGRPMRYRGC